MYCRVILEGRGTAPAKASRGFSLAPKYGGRLDCHEFAPIAKDGFISSGTIHNKGAININLRRWPASNFNLYNTSWCISGAGYL